MRKICFLLIFITMFASGCNFIQGDDIFALPMLPDDIVALQNEVGKLIKSGAEYAAPLSGSNRRPVQMCDFDGDGVDEALVFLRFATTNTIKIYVFKRTGENYSVIDAIEGEGDAISSVMYSDITNDGKNEIILGWQLMNGAVKAMDVYALVNEKTVCLLTSSYSSYAVHDINSDGVNELILLKLDTSESTAVAEMYTPGSDGMLEASSRAGLSQGIESFKRLKIGALTNNAPALFVASTLPKDALVTDILACRYGKLTNISLDPKTGVSGETLRRYTIYGTDIDGDGVFELPDAYQMPMLNSEQGSTYWKIDWRSYSIAGTAVHIMWTYHNFSDGYYIVIPEEYEKSLTVSRTDDASGERAVDFYQYFGGAAPPRKVFTVYTLTGDNRAERASLDGRFTLVERPDTIFAARIWERNPVTEEDLIGGFNIIQKEWITGEMTP